VSYIIIQVYSPTSDAEDQDIHNFYEKLQQVIATMANGDALFIIGDFNAKVGDKEEIGIVGKHGLGNRNQAGERLIDFCPVNNHFITKTFFQQLKHMQYTWISPDRLYRNQIDYILCSKTRRSTVQVAKALLGIDFGTDHQLLVRKLRIKLKAKANKCQHDLM